MKKSGMKEIRKRLLALGLAVVLVGSSVNLSVSASEQPEAAEPVTVETIPEEQTEAVSEEEPAVESAEAPEESNETESGENGEESETEQPENPEGDHKGEEPAGDLEAPTGEEGAETPDAPAEEQPEKKSEAPAEDAGEVSAEEIVPEEVAEQKMENGIALQAADDEVAVQAADEGIISGNVTWENKNITSPVKLSGETTITLVGTNTINCNVDGSSALDMNGYNLTIKGSGSLEITAPSGGGAIWDCSYWSETSGGKFTLESGKVTTSGGTYGLRARMIVVNGGELHLESYDGISTTNLTMSNGALYTTGTNAAIATYKGTDRSITDNLTILYSENANANIDDMAEGTVEDTRRYKEVQTIYIAEMPLRPKLTVQEQQGILREGVADQTAAFTVTGKNVKMDTLALAWEGDHTGLTATKSDDGTRITITTDSTVKQGEYSLKLTVEGTDGTSPSSASANVTVVVSGVPIIIDKQPTATDIQNEEKKVVVEVTASLADGLEGEIGYQWYVNGTAFTENDSDEITLGIENLIQEQGKDWLYSGSVYCVLTYGGYSVTTDTITATINTCGHKKYTPEGKCQQCGALCSKNTAFISEDGIATVIDDSRSDAFEIGGTLFSGGTYYLVRDVHRDLNAGNGKKGQKDVILDLQGYSIQTLNLGDFPYKTVTIKNGSVKNITTDGPATLILDGVTLQEQMEFSDKFDLTVKGNCVFKEQITFNGETRLQGGTFEDGINLKTSDGAKAVALLADGYAFADDDESVCNPYYNALNNRAIKVVSHACSYENGKCQCGRICDHDGKVDENGYCDFCHALVYPFAIGATRYTSLAEALNAAKAGDTVLLRGDYNLSGETATGETTQGVEISKNIILDLSNHTLSNRVEAPVLSITGSDVSIKNGTVKNTCTSKPQGAVCVGSYNKTNAKLTVEDVTFIGSQSNNSDISWEYALLIWDGNNAVLKSGTFTGGISINSSDLKHKDLLASGSAYCVDGKLVEREQMNGGTSVQVVKCTHPDGINGDDSCAYCGMTCKHTDMDINTGKCIECGTMIASISVTAGDTTLYYTDINTAVGKAAEQSGSTLKLLKDIALSGDRNNVSIGSGNFTIDWNGHTLSGETWYSLLAVTDVANVTLTDSKDGTGGVRNTGATCDAAIAVYYRASLLILGGTYSPQVRKDMKSYGSVQIRGGVFQNPSDTGKNFALYNDIGKLSDLMAPGYALYRDESCTEVVNIYESSYTELYATVYAGPHNHTFENGKCACGYVCPHTTLDADGKCTACEKQFIAQGTYSDGSIHNYETLSAAFADPQVTNITVVAQSQEKFDSWDGSGRTLTLNLNGKTVCIQKIASGNLIICDDSDTPGKLQASNAQNNEETINVYGTLAVNSGSVGKVTAEQDGTVTISGGSVEGLTVLDGSHVSLSGGSLGEITITSTASELICANLLAEGHAFTDSNNNIVNGYVSALINVQVVAHTHTCVWNADTHQKICACGFVEKVDTTAPVLSGVEDGKTYYGSVSITVEGEEDGYTWNVNGHNIIIPPSPSLSNTFKIDYSGNPKKIIKVTDAAGNSTTITIYLKALYTVSLSGGTGYTVRGEDSAGNVQNKVGQNTNYIFTVNIADGYSKTESYQVLVNDHLVTATEDSTNTYCVQNVTGDLKIRVEGVADITPPAMELGIRDNKFTNFFNKITFGVFFKNTQTATVTATDTGSGLQSVEYLLSETAFTDADAVTKSSGWKTMKYDDASQSYKVEIAPNQKAILYVRATDQSGNVQVINSDGMVVYTDAERITEAITFTRLYTNDITFSVKLNDNTVKAIYNGDTLIDSGNYTVTNDGKITLTNNYLRTLAAGGYTIRVAYNPMGMDYTKGDEPGMTAVNLTVQKRNDQSITYTITNAEYDGTCYQGICIIDKPTQTKVKLEYKLNGADDRTYTEDSPIHAGEYIVRVTLAENEDYYAAEYKSGFTIYPKELTISGLKVKDKTYDGRNAAEIDGTPILEGLVNGDTLQLVNGTPTFDRVSVGKDIPISFTEFTLAGDSTLAGDYKLVQPVGVTASIEENEKLADVKAISDANVKLEDKAALEQAKAELENLLENFGDEDSAEERKVLEDQLETIKNALTSISNVENTTEEVTKLPDVEKVKLTDKSEVDRVQNLVNGLTANEKSLLGQEMLTKINGLSERVAELERISYAPSIIEGAKQQWKAGTKEPARFRSNAEFEEFVKVLLDEKEVDPNNYLVYAGSTIVELKADYLKSLSAGEHTFSIVSKNGTASTAFTVAKAKKHHSSKSSDDSSAENNGIVSTETGITDSSQTNRTQSANTGDRSNPVLWMTLILLCGAAIGIIVRNKKRNKEES